MVRLTRIYTRTGDAGQTQLSDLSPVSKTDPRVAAYGDVDEANSAIGVALAAGDLPTTLARCYEASKTRCSTSELIFRPRYECPPRPIPHHSSASPRSM